jgi:hypothetical protein
MLLRVYLASLMENVRNRRWSRATSRALYGILVLLTSQWLVLSPDFWRAVQRSKPLYYDLIEDTSPEFKSATDWLF